MSLIYRNISILYHQYQRALPNPNSSAPDGFINLMSLNRLSDTAHEPAEHRLCYFRFCDAPFPALLYLPGIFTGFSILVN